jgi:metallo-beta-lactamase family protein
MKVTFLGADHEVTGSCTMLEVGGKLGLVDCGMEQGRDIFVNQTIPAKPADLDFVLLTHAHIDHSGNLPLLYKNGFTGTIYATEATCNLCAIMLRDSAHIQMSEAEYKSRKAKRAGTAPIEPLYDLNDADGAVKLLRPCSYGEMITVNDGVSIRFTDVGHLLGSACIEVWATEGGVTKKVVFSGDVGNINQPILKDPSTVSEADYVMIESTYGDRLHAEGRPDYVGLLAGYIQKTFDRGGNVVIPSFAVGRTQEMLYFIRQIKNRGMVTGHGDWPVYVDSPLAEEATAVFLQVDLQYIDKETAALVKSGENPLWFSGLKTAITSDDSKAINADESPKIILSASGMCDAGRIRHHLKHNLWRPESTVLFVGYQAEGSLGRSLVDGAQEVKLFGETIAVKAEIGVLPGISGHADKNGLLNWMRGFTPKPQKVFVNHGEDNVCDVFADTLHTELGLDTFAPYSGTVFDLLTGEITVRTEGIPVVRKVTANLGQPDGRAAEAYADAEKSGKELTAFLASCRGRSNRQLRSLAEEIRALIEKNR